MEPFFWWRPRSRQGKVQFFGGSSKHDDVGPTSKRDVGPTSRSDVGPTSLADVGPTPRRIGPTSARCRADEQTTSIRRRADVNYSDVADVVLTSGRRRRVYWAHQKIAPSPGGTRAHHQKWFRGPTRVHTPNTFGLHCAESVPQRHLRYAHIKPPVSTYLYSILI